MCNSRKPRLRAASKVRDSSAEPTPWLCQGFSTLNAASAWRGARAPNGRSSAARAQHTADETAVHDGIERQRPVGVIGDVSIGNRAAEPAAPAWRIETEQMLAVLVGLADPQFADHGAFRKNFQHF